jgi:UDP-N-acetylmuramate--alanine ligase
MNKLYENIYFIGIGGIGMSALAQYFLNQGFRVSGYDRVRNEMCIRLEKLGITIHYEDNINMINSYFKNPENTLVVYTPAIPTTHSELNWFKNNNFKIQKRSETLGNITSHKKTIAIAGSHGKTSVSGISAHIISNTEKSCTAFIGGILKNRNSNFIINAKSENIVVEADEYDRSFLNLEPSLALITSVEEDHLDIYENLENISSAFQDFANKTKNKGIVILNSKIDPKFKENLRKDLNIYHYGLNNENCDFYLYNIRYENGECYFDIKFLKDELKDIKYIFPGNHNFENVLAAASISYLSGVSLEEIRKGIETFKGIVRRFDYIVKKHEHIYIDDYAHHPSEISAFLTAVRQIFPNKKLTVIFQPHLYSRTQSFYEEFAKSLSISDDLILLPIYPAREEPIPGINSELILSLVSTKEKQVCEKNNLIELIESKKPELLVTMGAGDIDQFVQKIKHIFIK